MWTAADPGAGRRWTRAAVADFGGKDARLTWFSAVETDRDGSVMKLQAFGFLVVAAVTGGASALAPAPALAQGLTTGPSGLPLPRFVSVKSEPVNVRRGPSGDHEIAWTFTKAGLPVEIVQEFEHWRRIRDSDGQEGWVHQNLLSGRRTALVSPWEKGATTPVRAEPGEAAGVTAYLESNVVVAVALCRGGWCRVSGTGYKGWVPDRRLWGVYPDEKFD